MSGRLGASFLDDLRPGSAPPSEEQAQNALNWENLAGAFQALQQANSSHDYLQEAPSLQTLPDRLWGNQPSQDHGTADADYVKYYYQHRNLNPRLPPPSAVQKSDQKLSEQHADMDSATQALAHLLGAQQQIQEPSSRGVSLEALQNMRSRLANSGPHSNSPVYVAQRFASSCAVLGEVGSRNHSFTSGIQNQPWSLAPPSGGLRNELTTNSASQANQLEGFMQTFSPRTSFSNASVFSAHVTAPPGSMIGGLNLGGGDQDLGNLGSGLLVEPLFGGLASTGLSPRSSATSMQALLNDSVVGAANGSPARNSPMSQSFTLGSAKEGKGPLLSQSGRSRQPSKLRIGSTSEQFLGVDFNPGTPGRTTHALPDSLAPSHLANAGGDLSAAEAGAQQGTSGPDIEAAAALLSAAAANTSPSQQQQLQQMYLAMSYGMPYGSPAYGGYPGQHSQQQQQQQQQQYAQAQAYQAQPYGYPGLDMGMLGLAGSQGQMPQGMPYQAGMPPGAGYPLSPAEYAAYYQRYMENQAAMAAAAMGMPQQMGIDNNFMMNQGGGVGVNPQDNNMPDNGQGLIHNTRHRSAGGMVNPQFDRARNNNNGYMRSSVEMRMPGMGGVGGSGGLPPGPRPHETSMDSAVSQMERLHMNAGGVPLGNVRRNSRRETDGPISSRSSVVLDEFKANKSRRYEFSDVLGHMYEFSLDQHGSRFIQQKLEVASSEELGAALTEVLPRVTTLMTDVFGNYVVQKFFEYGTPAQRLKLAESLKGQVLQLSLQMYGCRVVQKALETLPPDAQCALLAELDGNVMRCVRDQNGNHVIQKVIEFVPTARITALLDNFLSCVVQLSSHPFGCRVMQRILEHCKDEQRRAVVMDEILRSAHALAQDQYGNYVIQHVLEHGTPTEKQSVVATLSPHVVALSMHKFASNVIEKCLTHCTPAERDAIVKTILGPEAALATAQATAAAAAAAAGNAGGSNGGGLGSTSSRSTSNPGVPAGAPAGAPSEMGWEGGEEGHEDALQQMMKDQFGNYVVQRVLEVCDDAQRDNLLQRVRMQLHLLKKFTYGKHIVARVEKLLSAGTKIQTHLRARPLPNDTAPLAAMRHGDSPSPASELVMSRSLSPESSMLGLVAAGGPGAGAGGGSSAGFPSPGDATAAQPPPGNSKGPSESGAAAGAEAGVGPRAEDAPASATP